MNETIENYTLSVMNGTNGSETEPLPPLGYAVCEFSSFQREMQLLYGAALALAAFLCTQSLLLFVLVSQVKKAARLVRALSKEAGVAGAEVRTNLLAPERSSSSSSKFQAKSKKSTNNKSATFTDPDNTSCAAPRDVDEEDL